jgi:hypothetical protein
VEQEKVSRATEEKCGVGSAETKKDYYIILYYSIRGCMDWPFGAVNIAFPPSPTYRGHSNSLQEPCGDSTKSKASPGVPTPEP